MLLNNYTHLSISLDFSSGSSNCKIYHHNFTRKNNFLGKPQNTVVLCGRATRPPHLFFICLQITKKGFWQLFSNSQIVDLKSQIFVFNRNKGYFLLSPLPPLSGPDTKKKTSLYAICWDYFKKKNLIYIQKSC